MKNLEQLWEILRVHIEKEYLEFENCCSKPLCTYHAKSRLWTTQRRCYRKFDLSEIFSRHSYFLGNFIAQRLITPMKFEGFTKFTQLRVVTSQFVIIIPCALHARIEDRTRSRHDLYSCIVLANAASITRIEKASILFSRPFFSWWVIPTVQ